MNEQEVLQVFGKVGAVITDSHIVYTSGLHGTAYVNKDAVYPELPESDALASALADRFLNDGVEVTIGPAVGGALFARDVARELSRMTGRRIRPVYAEKSDGDTFVIKRGYDKLILGKKILVVEDVLNTGGSVKKVIEATRAAGGIVVGLGVLCNRGGITPQDVGDVPRLDALVNVTFYAYDEATCPLCERNVPINTDVGKGREFLDRQNANTSHG